MNRWAWIGIVIAIAAACLLAFLAWAYIRPTTTVEKKDFLQLITQILGGLVLLVSLIFTWWNLNLTQQTASETLRVTQEGQVTDRFVRAVDQLGNKEKIELRLGAIYSLERISRTSEVDHWPIIELMCAFLRSDAPVSKKATAGAAAKNPHRIETKTEGREDIQAAATMIGRRHSAAEPNALYLASVDFSNLHLEGVNFAGAILWSSSFEGAVLAGANLREARLTSASLRDANLTEAHLEDAILSATDMEGAILERAHLEGAYMTDASGVTFQRLESASIDERTKLPASISEKERQALLKRSRSAENQEDKSLGEAGAPKEKR